MVNLLLAEIIKQRKVNLLRSVVIIPIALCLILMVVLGVLKFLGNDFGTVSNNEDFRGPQLGRGVFATGSSLVLVTLGGFYQIGLVLVAAAIMSREYTGNTIKMLAIREPSRPRLLLSKALFMAVLAALMTSIFIVCWLVFSLFTKFIYTDDGQSQNVDGPAIAKGLTYISIAFCVYLIWSMLGLLLATRFKSIVAAIIFYIVYSAIDGAVASIGAAALTSPVEGPNTPAWLVPLLKTAGALCPFTITANFTRLVGQADSSDFVATISPVQSIVVLLAWAGIFLGLALLVFNGRDITD